MSTTAHPTFLGDFFNFILLSRLIRHRQGEDVFFGDEVESTDCSVSLCRKASLSGLCAGAMGQFVASPADLVKVRLQMEGRRRLEGKPPRYYGWT